MNEQMEVKGEKVDLKPANLWIRIKKQCLNENPFITQNESGENIIECPRCRKAELEMNYTSFSIASDAMEWASPVLKCQVCRHIFSFVR
jgi:hypothetical protein